MPIRKTTYYLLNKNQFQIQPYIDPVAVTEQGIG